MSNGFWMGDVGGGDWGVGVSDELWGGRGNRSVAE